MATNSIASQSFPRGLLRQSFAASINRIYPMGGCPLYGLTSLIPENPIISFEHTYWTKIMSFPKIVAASGSAATIAGNNVTLTITADSGATAGYDNNGSFIVAGDLMVDDTTFEQFRVVSSSLGANGAGTIVLQRNLSSTFMSDANTMVAVNNATENKYPGISAGIAPNAATSGIPAASGNTTRAITLIHAGNAFEEGSVRPTAVSLVAQRTSNYTQIFRNAWATTNTAAVLQLVAGGGAVQESKMDCGAFHGLAIEKSLLFGQKSLTTLNGQPYHTMDGLYNIINNNAASNIVSLGAGAGGGTTWTDLEAALDKTLQSSSDPRGGNYRTILCGGQAKRGFTAIAQKNSNYNLEQDGPASQMTEWGLEVTKFRTSRGRFEIIEHPLLNAYGASSPLAKMAFIVDLGALRVNHLRKTREDLYNQNGAVVDNSIDAQGGVLTTELTLEVVNPAAFGILKNINNVGLAG